MHTKYACTIVSGRDIIRQDAFLHGVGIDERMELYAAMARTVVLSGKDVHVHVHVTRVGCGIYFFACANRYMNMYV